MTDYKSYKKFFTNGDLFTLTGTDFTGLVEIKDNIAFEFETKKTLTPKNSFETDLAYTNFYKDRVVTDLTIDLPNTLEDCVFAINDNFDYDLFKFKLDKIRENNNFIFSRCFIASNKLPWSIDVLYANLTAADSTDFLFQTLTATDSTFTNSIPFSESTKLSAVGNIFESTSQLNIDFDDRFALFAITSSTFIAMTGNETSLNIIQQSNEYEDDDNELKFGELGGIASNRDSVFLTDTLNNVILKYDIKGYINNDSSLGNKRNFIELLGGRGQAKNRTKFFKPTKLACTDKEIAVFDSGNKVIKLFDTMLNYKARIASINLNKETLGAMEFDPDFKSLYVITYGPSITAEVGFTGYLYRFSGNNYSHLERVVLEDVINSDKVVDISFSGVSSNYWFFSTTKKIYKKYKTRPAKAIGTFDSTRLGLLDFTPDTDAINPINNRWNYQDYNWKNADFIWNLFSTNSSGDVTNKDIGLLLNNVNSFNIFQGGNGNDKVVMMTNSRIYFFNEKTNEAYQRVIKSSNLTNYGIQGFSLNKDQYIQVSTVNNEITKVARDLLSLKNNIVGRFKGKFKSDVLVLDDYNYNLDFNEFVKKDLENLFIHSNEESLVAVINRCFTEIHIIQDSIANLVLPDTDKKVQTSFNSDGILII